MSDKRSVVEIAQLLFDCDGAEVNTVGGRRFLLLHYQWLRNGEPCDFDYTERKCVASGGSARELLDSLLEYHRLCQLTMEDYLCEPVPVISECERQVQS